METILQKCMDIDSVESFCGCIANAESADQAVRDFCDRAKSGSSVTAEELAALKRELSEGACC